MLECKIFEKLLFVFSVHKKLNVLKMTKKKLVVHIINIPFLFNPLIFDNKCRITCFNSYLYNSDKRQFNLCIVTVRSLMA